ncbi:MAG: dTDP-glucose 4,6-dehydratase [Alphaproteobacteria bacterium]|nr:dTDP-glucose 4,6-dehydratase [Alphaproteobacteria bacterium]
MAEEKTILVTGGCGFIGSHFVRLCLKEGYHVVNLDALTYAASESTLKDINESEPNYHFEKGYIQDRPLIKSLLLKYKPCALVNFAAETHVDRSIESPNQFIDSNILGTFTLLDESRHYYDDLDPAEKTQFKFLHVSTDEVFGSCSGEPFPEEAPYNPSSPYSASKAAADFIVRSYFHTYGFPVLITNCTNNYGPNQFPEKLIPLMIIKANNQESLPIYGDGMQIRDWLYVEDHVEAILTVLEKGKEGETYNIAGLNGEVPNKTVVEELCHILDELAPRPNDLAYKDLITYVTDRPGHDFRYALSIEKIKNELGWSPKVNFKEGLKQTVEWYLKNKWWWEEILDKGYKANRMGLRKTA